MLPPRDVINEYVKLDVTGMWGDGRVVAADGTQVDTWENNILAESHIRYGGIAYRHISDTYIALFSHFIPWGVGGRLHHRRVAAQRLRRPARHHPRGHPGQSLPVFGLAALLGFDLLPGVRHSTGA
jgi:TnpA family transposase